MNELLEARDKRVGIIESLLENNDYVLSLRCNYPGLKKDNKYTHKVINVFNEVIYYRFAVSDSIFLCDLEGPVYLYVVNHTDVIELKKQTILLENNHPLGRLVDIDVYYKSIKSVSRKDVSVPSRKCFLCGENAFNCMVLKKHELSELIEYYHRVVDKYDQVPLDIIEYTNQAMMYELCIYPKFGLVSPYSQGSHADMDHFLFIDSISVLNKYMYQFAQLGFKEQEIEDMYEEAIRIGLNCEREMFQKTKGVNTHKGLIFVLGSLVVACAKVIFAKKAFSDIFMYVMRLTKAKLGELNQLDTNKLSNGEEIYLKYGIAGARKEAALGFPIIQNALNILDIENKNTYVKTLIYIMSVCDDTTIIHRKGPEGLEYVRTTMKELWENTTDQKLMEINDRFIKEGISPGGAADLLCGTIFLSLIKKYLNKGE